MVGLSDIPCVGEIVNRVSNAIVDSLFLGLNYMFCYKNLFNDLNLEMEKLTNKEMEMRTKANAERDRGKDLCSNVSNWLGEVEKFRRSATEFSEKYRNRASWRCIDFLPIPQPVNRFQLGREAAQKRQRVSELYELGKDLLAGEIAYLPQVKNIGKSDTVFFESRKAAYMELWEELVSEGSCSVLGIYGMPGVGKTRMMEQLQKEAEEKKIFHKVVRADVGGDSLDVIKLQNQIAKGIDPEMHFVSQDDLERRAFQLKRSIMNNGKVLVILDDVWTEISLDDIGIPSVNDSSCKGLKILLTSRKKDACLRNNCKHPVQITVLTDDEAWALFSNTVGDSMPTTSLAHKVCQKCAGLPLLIHAVGKALRGTPRYSWEDALDQLKKGTIEKIPDIEPQVYSCVKFSIDKLPADDARPCLFLCSLYREDAEINIRKLIEIATGLHLVDGGKSRVCTMLDILSSSSLLLDSQVHYVIKLHDLIRDVARYVAIKDQIYAFSIVRGGSRLRDSPDYCTRKFLDLHLENNDCHVSGGKEWPELQRLWLHCNNHKVQLSVDFSSMFVNLIYLLIERMSSSSGLHFSLHSLVNLRTLILDDCEMTHLNQTNLSFFPENLVNLCFWDCHLPVPLLLPNLEHLRKLEIKGLTSSKIYMLPNTISRLSNLEELHIQNGIEIQGSEPSSDAAPILTEISNLIGLRSLQMSFRRSEPFKDTNIFDKLDEYDIVVPIHTAWNYLLNPSASMKKCIYLDGPQLEGLESLIEKAEQVKLENSDIDLSSIWNSNRKAFSDLRELHIVTCNTMGYLAKMPEDEIHNSCQPLTSFSDLTSLYITNCSTIKYLFSKSVAKGLGQLQYLHVGACPVMEAIITNDDTDNGDIITFSKLCSLQLGYLPRLKSFYMDNYASSTSVMDSSAIPGVRSPQFIFNGMVDFPSLEKLEVRGIEDTDIWGEYYCTDNSSFCKLKSLGVHECNKLETVFPPAMLNKMRNLETIDIWDCNSLKYVLPPSIAGYLIHLKSMWVDRCPMVREIIGPGKEKEITERIVFPELTDLNLYGLTNLTSFWCYETGKENNYKAEFPNLVNLLVGSEELSIPDNFPCQRLELLHVSNCGYPTALPLSIFRSLLQLQALEIFDSALLEEIVEDDRGDMDVKTITLPQLKYFALRNLPNIKSFIRVANCDFHMPVLTEVTVDKCGISTLFTFSALRSLPQLQQLEISNCSLLEEIVEGVRGDEASVMDKKTITLSQLRSVTLTNLPNLKSFIRCANCEFHMPALSNVDIRNCGLSTLFTCSVSRKLHQLAKLNISNCTYLESIVDDVEDDETSLTDDKIITFSQLTSLHLWGLPNLKCFSNTSSYDFCMPKLVAFMKYSCPQLEYFTLSKTSAPRVQVRTKEGLWEHIPGLDDYIRQTAKQEVASSDRNNDQELETESEGVEEVQPQDSKEND